MTATDPNPWLIIAVLCVLIAIWLLVIARAR